MERVKSGIPGLDKLLGGGFPKGSVILVLGGPGVGKTLFGSQYIYYGAKNGEHGIFISFEEPEDSLKKEAREIGLDFEPLIKEEKVIIKRYRNIGDINVFLQDIEKMIRKIGAKRLVVDSLSTLTMLSTTFKSLYEELFRWIVERKITPPYDALIRRVLYKIIDKLKEWNVTTLVTSEAIGEYSREKIAEFICDGIIFLKKEVVGKNVIKTISIRKMRGTKIDEGIYEYEITDNGIKVILD